MDEEIAYLWCMILEEIQKHYTWRIICNRALDNSKLWFDCFQLRDDGYTPLYDVIAFLHPISDLVETNLTHDLMRLTVTVK